MSTGTDCQSGVSLSLEIFKTHLNRVLGNWLWVALLEQVGWTR